MAESTSAQVSSAAAYEGVPEWRSEETTMPSRVQAVMSMLRIDATLADQAKPGQAF